MKSAPLLALLACALLCGGVSAAPPAPFPGEIITIVSEDNWQLGANYLKPEPGRPVLLLLHSLRRDRKEWLPLALEAQREGFGLLAIDLRGHGESINAPGGQQISFQSFKPQGTDNEFNQMLKDADSAIGYLVQQGVNEADIILLGAGIGANTAVRAAAVHPQLRMMGLLSPSLTAKDILTVNPIRVYGDRPLLLMTSSDSDKSFKEVLILRSIALLSAKVNPRRITFIALPKGQAGALLNSATIGQILQWVKTPERPEEAVGVSSGTASATQDGAAQSEDSIDVGINEDE